MTNLAPQNFPVEWCFPKPPFRIDRSLEASSPRDDVIAAYLVQIRSWRSTVLAFLNRSDESSGLETEWLSERACRALAIFLDSDWSPNMTEWATQSPYNMIAFPAEELNSGSKTAWESLLDILRWRAGVNDCLDDIWDVLGEPELDLYECVAIGKFLYPSEQTRLCCFCLTEFPPDQFHPDQHECLLLSHVRAKWPKSPFAHMRIERPEP